MEDLRSMTVREIALELPFSTRVFEEFQIDYCCGGRKPFEEACDAAGVDPDRVERRIHESSDSSEIEPGEKFDSLPPDRLIDHILENHHAFTRMEIGHLAPLMEKVANRHGENHPNLFTLKSHVLTLFTDLESHMAKEEAILFPYVRGLAQREGSISSASPAFGSVRSPIEVMMKEHDSAGELLRQMRSVASGYRIPDGACPSFTALYFRLAALEQDLHQHIHLENNILFPKALELEASVFPLAVH